MEVVEQIGSAALRLYAESAPFLLVGCLLGGLVYAFFPGRVIERWLGGKGVRTIFGAALVGAPLPLCSCGVVPAAITLRRRGASIGATVAFLVATPETGPDSLLVSFALLDPLFALFRPLAAIVTAVVSGLLATFGEEQRPLPQAPPQRLCEICALPDEGDHFERGYGRHGVAARLRRAMSYGFGELLEEIGGWLLIGLLAAGALTVFVDPAWVTAHLGSPWLQRLAALLVGVPLYVCASASTPIAAGLVVAGFSPGAALVFMLAGPATNVASLLVLRRELGGRVVALMLLGIAGGSLLLGALLDLLYTVTGLTPLVQAGAAGELLPTWLGGGSAALLTLLVARCWWKKWRGSGREQSCATCAAPHVHVASHAQNEPSGSSKEVKR